MSQVLREAYQLRLGFFVVQRFMKNSLVLNMQGSLSAEMSHQSDAMSHHFWKNVTSKWSNVTSLSNMVSKMSHQSEAMSHHFWENVTSKWNIVTSLWHFWVFLAPEGCIWGFQGEIPSDQKHFVIQNAYLAKPEFSALSDWWLREGRRGKEYWFIRNHDCICKWFAWISTLIHKLRILIQ